MRWCFAARCVLLHEKEQTQAIFLSFNCVKREMHVEFQFEDWNELFNVYDKHDKCAENWVQTLLSHECS